jgi:hypothetical protein
MYDSAGRGVKSKITSKIIQLVKESFGRFLKQEPNGVWTEVEDDVARLKASTAFRTWRRVESQSKARHMTQYPTTPHTRSR